VEIDLVPADPVRWARIPDDGRLVYGTDPAPGTPVAASEAVTREARIERFVALVARVGRIDAVSLAHDPHRRAHLRPDGARWIAP
jgi:hypothetical protein